MMLNSSSVQAIEPGQYSGSCIWLSSGVLAVKETPDEVLALMRGEGEVPIEMALTAYDRAHPVSALAAHVSQELAVGDNAAMRAEMRYRGWVLERADAAPIPRALGHSVASTAFGDVCATTWPEIADQAHDGAVLALKRLEAMGWVLERANKISEEEIFDSLDIAQRIIKGMCLALSDRNADWSMEKAVGVQAIERVRAMVRE